MYNRFEFDAELTNPTDQDIEKCLRECNKEKPARLLLAGEVNLSSKSIAAIISSILDGSVRFVQLNDNELFRDLCYEIKRTPGDGIEKFEMYRKRDELGRKGFVAKMPFGNILQDEGTKRIAYLMGTKEVYWKNQFSLKNIFSYAYTVREQLQADPDKTGSLSFVMPEDKIPTAIMVSSLLTQYLMEDFPESFLYIAPHTRDWKIAGKKAFSSVPVDFVDGQYRITVGVNFSRKKLGEILGVDATRYKRESINDGSHYIYIPERDLNEALGLTEPAQVQSRQS
jgi:hypothetical protein